jgi:hypothetical protein
LQGELRLTDPDMLKELPCLGDPAELRKRGTALLVVMGPGLRRGDSGIC